MKRQTSLCLVVAAAVGVVMATASIGSSEPRSQSTQLHAADCRAEFGDFTRCLMSCSGPESSPQEAESCRRYCWEAVDPACRIEVIRQPELRASTQAPQAVAQRR
jgi:hypothetical protein